MSNSRVNQPVEEEYIKLDQFLKYIDAVATGGHAKVLIQSGEVSVNGVIETRRGRKLINGDRVTIEGQTYNVSFD
jgi:ribosome-associated protein